MAPSRRAVRRFIAETVEKINAYGWVVQYVFGTADQATCFAYTVGLARAGVPELAVVGPIAPETVTKLLNRAARQHLRTEFTADQIVDVEFTFALQVRPIARPVVAANLTVAALIHQAPVQGLQLVWPDAEGRYPGQPGYAYDAHVQQFPNAAEDPPALLASPDPGRAAG